MVGGLRPVPGTSIQAQLDAMWNGMSLKDNSKRRLLSRWPAAFIAAVLIGTTALVLYVEASISELKQVLPVEVLRQERDVVFMIDDLAALQQAIREARGQPGAEGRQAIIGRIELVERRVAELTEAYSFSNQIGIASMHATLRPVAGDLKLWLSDGVQGLAPDSEVVLDLAAERVAAARQEIVKQFGEANANALAMLQEEATDLERFRGALILVVIVVASLTVVLVAFIFRERRSELAAAAAQQRLRESIESLAGGFALFDAEDRLVLCNQIYRRRAAGAGNHIYPGMSFEEIARMNAVEGCVADLSTGEDLEAWLQSRLVAHRSAHGDFEIPWHDGRTYLMTERRTHDGGIASVSTDITELKRARELAEQANRAKTRFLAAASHDLRQPLHAIELFVAALEATVDDEEAHCIIGDLREASNAAGRLLNALLDVSELESGKLEGRFMHFPVQQLLDRMLRVYGPQAQERGLDLRVVPSSHVIDSDPNLLERILGNLLSNAVRYTPSGRILLGCRRRRNKLRIEVWDTGLGIPESERQKIFEEFHQIDNPARERQRGIGLGLSIVRRLANILGHEIFLHSVRGQGSVFAVELDLTGKSIDLSQRGSGRSPAGMRENATVLVLDDDLQVRKGMVRALESWGCRVKAAEDYATAAKVVSEMPAGVDLIVADYRLPNGCNGVRAVGRLRMLAGRMVPVLIVTADQGEEEMREITEQGFPTLQKPVDPDALALAVTGLLEGFADRGLKETGD